MQNCDVCGTERNEQYMLFRDNKYFCDAECYQSYYTVRGINITASGGGILSTPPAGSFKVVNIYVEPTTGKLTIEYDNTPT
jgi:hypothetical protein